MLKIDTIKKPLSKKGWILVKPFEFKVFETDGSGTVLECMKPRLTVIVNSAKEKDYLKAINKELYSLVKKGELDSDVIGKEVLLTNV